MKEEILRAYDEQLSQSSINDATDTKLFITRVKLKRKSTTGYKAVAFVSNEDFGINEVGTVELIIDNSSVETVCLQTKVYQSCSHLRDGIEF